MFIKVNFQCRLCWSFQISQNSKEQCRIWDDEHIAGANSPGWSGPGATANHYSNDSNDCLSVCWWPMWTNSEWESWDNNVGGECRLSGQCLKIKRRQSAVFTLKKRKEYVSSLTKIFLGEIIRQKLSICFTVCPVWKRYTVSSLGRREATQPT